MKMSFSLPVYWQVMEMTAFGTVVVTVVWKTQTEFSHLFGCEWLRWLLTSFKKLIKHFVKSGKEVKKKITHDVFCARFGGVADLSMDLKLQSFCRCDVQCHFVPS